MGKKLFIHRVVLRAILIAYGVIVVYPLLWALYTSFKTNREFFQNPWALPETLYFENYKNAWG